LKIAFSAASFSTSPGAMKKAGATNDIVSEKSGRRKSGNASTGNKTSQGARTKQPPGSSMCSRAFQTDEDDPGHPYFNYVDHSLENDDEPLVFLVPPSRVATFPVKLHVILSRKDFSHVICWMPHGRSWRLVDPVEFEMTIIPTYFGHASLSSFMRQANGWGFKQNVQFLLFELWKRTSLSIMIFFALHIFCFNIDPIKKVGIQTMFSSAADTINSKSFNHGQNN